MKQEKGNLQMFKPKRTLAYWLCLHHSSSEDMLNFASSFNYGCDKERD